MILEGTVKPGFEPLKDLYANKMRTLAERNTQLCVYVGEECVADLWASAIDDTEFSGDSLVNVFSSGKTLEAITLAMLFDQGLLDYNAKITDYWPEFAGGESATTVADLMRHEAGLAAFDTTIEPAQLQPEQIKENALGAVIERQQQKFPQGTDGPREYHAMTRGWIANEVFRRVEPQGRTIGEFLRQEVSAPFDADAYIGLQAGELDRVNKVQMLGFGYQFAQGLVPRMFGRKVEPNLAQTIAKLSRLRAGIRNRTTGRAPVPVTGMGKISVFDSPLVCTGEIPSAGAKCSARGLAKLAAVMANGGSLNGQQLMSNAAYDALHGEGIERHMMAMTRAVPRWSEH